MVPLLLLGAIGAGLCPGRAFPYQDPFKGHLVLHQSAIYILSISSKLYKHVGLGRRLGVTPSSIWYFDDTPDPAKTIR